MWILFSSNRFFTSKCLPSSKHQIIFRNLLQIHLAFCSWSNAQKYFCCQPLRDQMVGKWILKLLITNEHCSRKKILFHPSAHSNDEWWSCSHWWLKSTMFLDNDFVHLNSKMFFKVSIVYKAVSTRCSHLALDV